MVWFIIFFLLLKNFWLVIVIYIFIYICNIQLLIWSSGFSAGDFASSGTGDAAAAGTGDAAGAGDAATDVLRSGDDAP